MCHLSHLFRDRRVREYEAALAQAKADVERMLVRDRMLADAAETAKRAWDAPVREREAAPETVADRAADAVLTLTSAAMLTPYAVFAVFALQALGV